MCNPEKQHSPGHMSARVVTVGESSWVGEGASPKLGFHLCETGVGDRVPEGI